MRYVGGSRRGRLKTILSFFLRFYFTGKHFVIFKKQNDFNPDFTVFIMIYPQFVSRRIETWQIVYLSHKEPCLQYQMRTGTGPALVDNKSILSTLYIVRSTISLSAQYSLEAG